MSLKTASDKFPKLNLKPKDKSGSGRGGATEATPTREKKKEGKSRDGTESKQPSGVSSARKGVAAVVIKPEERKPSAREKDGATSKGNKKESDEQMVGGPAFSGFRIAEEMSDDEVSLEMS